MDIYQVDQLVLSIHRRHKELQKKKEMSNFNLRKLVNTCRVCQSWCRSEQGQVLGNIFDLLFMCLLLLITVSHPSGSHKAHYMYIITTPIMPIHQTCMHS